MNETLLHPVNGEICGTHQNQRPVAVTCSSALSSEMKFAAPAALKSRTDTQQKATPQGARQTTEPDPRETRLWLEICELLRGACTGTTRPQPG